MYPRIPQDHVHDFNSNVMKLNSWREKQDNICRKVAWHQKTSFLWKGYPVTMRFAEMVSSYRVL